jgi:hypothetical protein
MGQRLCGKIGAYAPIFFCKLFRHLQKITSQYISLFDLLFFSDVLLKLCYYNIMRIIIL